MTIAIISRCTCLKNIMKYQHLKGVYLDQSMISVLNVKSIKIKIVIRLKFVRKLLMFLASYILSMLRIKWWKYILRISSTPKSRLTWVKIYKLSSKWLVSAHKPEFKHFKSLSKKLTYSLKYLYSWLLKL